MSISDSDCGTEYDSDEELQEAFARGLLMPGLNIISEEEKREYKNNVGGLKKKLTSFKQNLPWVERLDLVTDPAVLSPELALKVQEQKDSFLKGLNNGRKANYEDPILNDFQREIMFHQQAQAAVIEGILKLKELGIPTKRPSDYFAQMAKADDHMQKVREALLKRQKTVEHRDKVRQMRQMKKMSKQVQVEAKLQQAKEKREFMDQVKKYRQKKRTDLDFLNDKKKGKKGNENNRSAAKRKHKDMKYGFGGKKRGSKLNTKDSAEAFDHKGFNKAKGKGKKAPQRPGKSKRMKQKSRQNR